MTHMEPYGDVHSHSPHIVPPIQTDGYYSAPTVNDAYSLNYFTSNSQSQSQRLSLAPPPSRHPTSATQFARNNQMMIFPTIHEVPCRMPHAQTQCLYENHEVDDFQSRYIQNGRAYEYSAQLTLPQHQFGFQEPNDIDVDSFGAIETSSQNEYSGSSPHHSAPKLRPQNHSVYYSANNFQVPSHYPTRTTAMMSPHSFNYNPNNRITNNVSVTSLQQGVVDTHHVTPFSPSHNQPMDLMHDIACPASEQSVTKSILSDYPPDVPDPFMQTAIRGSLTSLPRFIMTSPRGALIPAVSSGSVPTVSPAPSLVSISSCSTQSGATPTRMSLSQASSVASTPSPDFQEDCEYTPYPLQSAIPSSTNDFASSRRLFDNEVHSQSSSTSLRALATHSIPSSSSNPSLQLRVPIKINNSLSAPPKTYHCSICGKEFAHQGSLSRHVRAHTGDKPFQCRICLRRFQQAGNLTVHLRSHTDAKPYECEVCSRRFRHPCSMNNHRKRKHPL